MFHNSESNLYTLSSCFVTAKCRDTEQPCNQNYGFKLVKYLWCVHFKQTPVIGPMLFTLYYKGFISVGPHCPLSHSTSLWYILFSLSSSLGWPRVLKPDIVLQMGHFKCSTGGSDHFSHLAGSVLLMLPSTQPAWVDGLSSKFYHPT